MCFAGFFKIFRPGVGCDGSFVVSGGEKRRHTSLTGFDVLRKCCKKY